MSCRLLGQVGHTILLDCLRSWGCSLNKRQWQCLNVVVWCTFSIACTLPQGEKSGKSTGWPKPRYMSVAPLSFRWTCCQDECSWWVFATQCTQTLLHASLVSVCCSVCQCTVNNLQNNAQNFKNWITQAEQFTNQSPWNTTVFRYSTSFRDAQAPK